MSLTHPVKSSYRDIWLNFRQERNQRHKAYLRDIPYSDLKVFELVFQHLKKPQVLHFSNSSVIRYANMFKLSSNLEVYCNRGTSGIDGSVSTAIGSALKSEIPTTLVCGDLAFFYDSNGIWNKNIPPNFKIILINNGGGGIFRILPGKKAEPYFHQFFETRHELRAEHLCKMFDFDYQKVTNEDELRRQLPSFLSTNESPQLIEIITPTETNDAVLLAYFGYVQDIDE